MSWFFLRPVRFRFYSRSFCKKAVRFLDIGCGDGSPTLTKRCFSDCEYHGVDREAYGNSAADLAAVDFYYEKDLTRDSLDFLADDSFDVLNCSHVIEHLPNGLEILDEALGKVKSGGRAYVEFPGIRSFFLPSAVGTLNFCDDSTHVRVYTLEEVVNVFLKHRFVIRKLGTRRDYIRLFLTPLSLVLSGLHWVLKGRLHSRGLWDVFGFAQFVYGVKR